MNRRWLPRFGVMGTTMCLDDSEFEGVMLWCEWLLARGEWSIAWRDRQL